MIGSLNMVATSNNVRDIIQNGNMKALMIEFQKPRRVRNTSLLGEKLISESMIISYVP